jgi:dTMP kinase
MQPLFIAFEGIDGSGKSTQAKLLAEKMSTRNLKTHLTFEPTNSDIGKMIREIFAGKREGDQKSLRHYFVLTGCIIF